MEAKASNSAACISRSASRDASLSPASFLSLSSVTKVGEVLFSIWVSRPSFSGVGALIVIALAISILLAPTNRPILLLPPHLLLQTPQAGQIVQL